MMNSSPERNLNLLGREIDFPKLLCGRQRSNEEFTDYILTKKSPPA